MIESDDTNLRERLEAAIREAVEPQIQEAVEAILTSEESRIAQLVAEVRASLFRPSPKKRKARSDKGRKRQKPIQTADLDARDSRYGPDGHEDAQKQP